MYLVNIRSAQCACTLLDQSVDNYTVWIIDGEDV